MFNPYKSIKLKFRFIKKYDFITIKKIKKRNKLILQVFNQYQIIILSGNRNPSSNPTPPSTNP
jgi:hypothetical protein